MIKFERELLLQFSLTYNTLITVNDGNESMLLRGQEAITEFAKLIDNFAWWKINIVNEMKRDDFSWTTDEVPEEHKYDYDEDIVIRILLKREKRVKSFYDKQDLPLKLRNVLPEKVRKELLATERQVKYCESLLWETDFLFPITEVRKLTRREASALIQLLQTLKLAENEEIAPYDTSLW